MNKNQHAMFSMGLYIVIVNIFIFALFSKGIHLPKYYYKDVFWAAFWVNIFYFVGCALPDFDHQAVQKKFHIRWAGKIWHTVHRGHWHSIIANGLYGLLCLGVMWIFQIVFWWIPLIAGIMGFFSHLLADDLIRFNMIRNSIGMDDLKSKPKRAIKLW